MDFRSTYDGIRERVCRSFVVLKDKSNENFVYHRTKQSFKDECDINRIVDRYPDITNENYMKSVAQVLSDTGLYGEYDSSMDYSKAIEIVNRAHAQFDTLPSKLRDRFANEPTKFLDYISDSSNFEEAQKLGLLKVSPPINTIVSPDLDGQVEQPAAQQPQVIQPTEKAATQ